MAKKKKTAGRPAKKKTRAGGPKSRDQWPDREKWADAHLDYHRDGAANDRDVALELCDLRDEININKRNIIMVALLIVIAFAAGVMFIVGNCPETWEENERDEFYGKRKRSGCETEKETGKD